MAKQRSGKGGTGKAGPAGKAGRTETTAALSKGASKTSGDAVTSIGSPPAPIVVDRPNAIAAAPPGDGGPVGLGGRRRMPLWIRESLSCLVSLVAHMVFLIALGLWVVRGDLPEQFTQLEVTPACPDKAQI